MRSPCLFAVAIAIPSGTPSRTMAVAISAALLAAAPFSFLLCFEAKALPVAQGNHGLPNQVLFAAS